MMNSKKEIIKNFLLEGNDDIKKEKFEIAWDIWENFGGITKDIRKCIAKNILGLLYQLMETPQFKEYKMQNFGLDSGEKWKPLILYKKEWLLGEQRPILGYALEFERNDFYDLAYGIVKYDKEIPFTGKWNDANISEEWKRLFASIKGSLPELWNISDWWIIWKYFNNPYGLRKGMDRKEFKELYKSIFIKSNKTIDEGCKEVAKYYIEKLTDLKDATEYLVDEFIELYKKRAL